MALISLLRVSIRATKSTVTSYCWRRLMSSKKFKNIYFTKEHEWISVSDNIGTVGISYFAQALLGDVVYAQLPDIGKELLAGEECGALESAKSTGDVFTPVSGTVTNNNNQVTATPTLINISCYDKGWLFKVKLKSPEELDQLMDKSSYNTYLISLDNKYAK